MELISLLKKKRRYNSKQRAIWLGTLRVWHQWRHQLLAWRIDCRPYRRRKPAVYLDLFLLLLLTTHSRRPRQPECIVHKDCSEWECLCDGRLSDYSALINVRKGECCGVRRGVRRFKPPKWKIYCRKMVLFPKRLFLEPTFPKNI